VIVINAQRTLKEDGHGDQSTQLLAARRRTVGTVATTPLALAADKFGRDRDWTGDTTVTYPEPAWEVRDKRFAGVQGTRPCSGICRHGNGPRASGAKARVDGRLGQSA